MDSCQDGEHVWRDVHSAIGKLVRTHHPRTMFTAILILIVCLAIFYLVYLDVSRPLNFPPGPRGLPVVGCTPLLRQLSAKLGGQHLALSHLAAKYKTPVLGLKLGRELVVVALSPPIVRQVLMRDEFIGRPDSFFVRLRCFGAKQGITFADGDLWHEQRNFTLRTLRDLGMGKPRMELLIQQQTEELLNLFNQRKSGVRPMEVLSPCILRTLWEIVAGERLAADHPQLTQLINILKIRNRAFDMAGGVLSQFPWIRFLAPDWSGYSLLNELNGKMREFLMDTVNRHKETVSEAPRDLIDAFLLAMNTADKSSNYTETQLVMLLVDLFLGGASSTTTTLDFAILLMVANPDVQNQVQKELDKVLAGTALPTPSDKQRLPYTEAVLLEVQRLCTVIPVIGPRRVLKDTSLGGYHIPKGTTVLMSEWSVHRDALLYSQPAAFLPERFLQEDRSHLIENLIPFGHGKRRCLGESLAKPCLFVMFASIMKTFRVSAADGSCVPDVLAPVPGIILTPPPYTAQFTLRE